MTVVNLCKMRPSYSTQANHLQQQLGMTIEKSRISNPEELVQILEMINFHALTIMSIIVEGL